MNLNILIRTTSLVSAAGLALLAYGQSAQAQMSTSEQAEIGIVETELFTQEELTSANTFESFPQEVASAVTPEAELATEEEVYTSATTLQTESPIAQTQEVPLESDTTVAQLGAPVVPGRATRSGASYIGIAGNIGLSDTTGDNGFSVMSKIGLTPTLSARPSAVFGDNTLIMVPVTVDFAPRGVEAIDLAIAPYVGAGVAFSTGNNSTVGPMITGGVDLPLSPEFTANAAINVGFIDDTDVGLMIGVGYNFPGF